MSIKTMISIFKNFNLFILDEYFDMTIYILYI